MTERQLKLIKFERNGTQPLSQSQPPVPLTAAEQAEATYFRKLVEERAARQMMLHRIMAELSELDEISPAA
jgi:hypothetical protein